MAPILRAGRSARVQVVDAHPRREATRRAFEWPRPELRGDIQGSSPTSEVSARSAAVLEASAGLIAGRAHRDAATARAGGRHGQKFLARHPLCPLCQAPHPDAAAAARRPKADHDSRGSCAEATPRRAPERRWFDRIAGGAASRAVRRSRSPTSQSSRVSLSPTSAGCSRLPASRRTSWKRSCTGGRPRGSGLLRF
jgi:hypothetical protein